MNTPNAQPLFLEQRSYRQRRVRDVARVLPIVGVLLWAIPLLWPRDGAEAATTGAAAQYIFVVWFVLIVACAIISRRITSDAMEDEKPD